MSGARLAHRGVIAKPTSSALEFPETLPGFSFRFRAEDIAGSDGDAVSSWSNRGTGGAATQGTAGNRPLLKRNIWNGKSTVRFDGSNDFLDASGVSLSQPDTIVVVASCGAAGAKNLIDGITTRQAIYVSSSFRHGLYSGTGSGIDLTLGAVWSASPEVCVAIFNGASSTAWANGTALTTTVSPGANNLSGLRIGSFNGSAASWNGDLAEIIGYTGAIGTSDRDALETYLGAYYGITVV